MKPAASGFRVAVVGASSLLGKELLAVLQERQFPISRLVTPNALDNGEPDLPVLDLGAGLEATVAEADVGESDLDFVFLAAPFSPPTKKGIQETHDLPFLQSVQRLAAATHCKVIDLCECLAAEKGGRVSVPFLDRTAVLKEEGAFAPSSRFHASAHPATIVISAVLLRLSLKFAIDRVAVEIFDPVSEIGPKAIDELQKQTMNLLSFQKIPQMVFGTQLAFNLLPRLGRTRGQHFTEITGQLRRELASYLGGRAPLPALRVVYSPVFHSLACSLYVELVEEATLEALTQVLAGEPISLRKATDTPPSQVDVSGSSEIVVDALTIDATHPRGLWIWAAADNLRLAAVNAVQIAEGLKQEVRIQ